MPSFFTQQIGAGQIIGGIARCPVETRSSSAGRAVSVRKELRAGLAIGASSRKVSMRAGCRGLVAAGMGSGGAPGIFLDALAEAVKAGVPVVVASQAGNGRTMARRTLTERGLTVADNLLPRKARILLMLALCRNA